MEFLRKLTFLRAKQSFDRDLGEEIQFHVEERADELVQGGLSRAAALQQARREFGSSLKVAEEARSAWRFSWLEDFAADLKYAARALLREPTFFAVAVLSLGLGIGINTSIFSLTMEVLMSQPSVSDPGTLGLARLGGNSHIDLPPYKFLRESETFPEVGGIREDGDINWRNGDVTQRLFAMRVTDNFFSMAGIPVLMGRGIREGEPDTVVISHRMWRAKLAADPSIIGRHLILDGRPHAIVGVLPEDHRTLLGMGLSPDLYAPVRGESAVELCVRLPAETTIAAARERLRLVANQLDSAMPERHFKYADDIRLRIVNESPKLAGEKAISLFFAMLMAVVSLLLVIACLNVSGLLLARASTRTQEFAIRTSLGAGRGRLLRQLLTESLLLATTGTVFGLALNLFLTRMIRYFPLENLPIPVAFRIDPDWRLLAYASLVGVACAVLVGVLPAWRSSRSNAGDALKQGERQLSGKLNLRRALVIAQVAGSMIVLVTAALFARNLLQSVSTHPGFRLDNTMYVSIRLVPDKYPAAKDRDAFVNLAVSALAGVPGVESAAATRLIPFNDDSTHGGPLRPDTSAEDKHFSRHTNQVGPGYFRTLGVSVLAGRELDGHRADEIVVNQSFARLAFGQVNPVGHSVRFGDRERTIVGLVQDTKYAWMNDHQRPAVFEHFAMEAGGGRAAIVNLMVRTGVNPESLVRPIGGKLLGVDPSAAVEVKPMQRAMGMALLPSRVGSGLLGLMGLLGLLLTGIGLYGLMSYSVARRSREIGLRVALGATPGSIRQLVLGEGARLIIAGLAIGLFCSYFVTQPLARFLVEGVTTSDPLTYIAVSVILVLAGWTACATPARRALRIDPMEALRYE